MAYIGQSLTEGTRRVYTYTATASQSTFNAVYEVGAVDVYQNGILLQPSDYNSSSGSSVVLGVGAAVNDEITIIAHNTFSVVDTVSSSQGGTFAGAVTASNGLIVDDDGATPLTVDRATSNGDVIDIQKDGTSVGTIGANGSNLYIGSPEGTDAYIGFGNNIIRPVTSAGASRDNAIDLGYTGMRFKDIYLSGGAYLGGTGAANKLEDYEEGTWSPSLSGVTVSGGTVEATYVKVGNLVTAVLSLVNITISGGNSSTISGLPFTSNIRSTSSHPALYYHQAGGYPVYALLEKNSTNMYLQYNRSNNSWASAPFYSGTNRYIHFSVTYTT